MPREITPSERQFIKETGKLVSNLQQHISDAIPVIKMVPTFEPTMEQVTKIAMAVELIDLAKAHLDEAILASVR